MVDGVSATSSAGMAGGPNASVGKDDFLQMLIAQLKNQDPLNPMDGTQFASQLAEFSSLEQITNLNENVKTSIDANYLLSQSINNTMTATLIGKDVKIGRTNIEYNGQESVDIGYTLPAQATSVTVNIYNEAGALIKSIESSQKDVGDAKLNWDFTDNGGRKIGNGNYHFEIEAKNVSNEDMTVNMFMWGQIDGIKFGENGSTILVNNTSYLLSDILEILNPAQTVVTENTTGNKEWLK